MGGSRAGGFTLGELLLVLLNLGLAAVLLFAVLGRVRQSGNSDRFIADLQEISAIFSAYHQQHQAWLPTLKGEVVMPPGLQDALIETSWGGGSPFGGSYGWDNRGAVVLTAFAPGFPLTVTRAELQEIDRRIDDGNLATGRFRTGFNGWPVYFVEIQP